MDVCGERAGVRPQPTTSTRDKEPSAIYRPHPLVPKQSLGTQVREALLRGPQWGKTRSGASRTAFPSRAWERETWLCMFALTIEVWTFGIVGIQRRRAGAAAAHDHSEHGGQHNQFGGHGRR